MSLRRGPRLPLEELAPYLLNVADPPAPFDWTAVFGADQPVEIEIGFGKGLFLLNASEARPDLHFVGVEIVRKFQLYTATRLALRGRSNVRVACADARLFLRDCVVSSSLQALHVYFPDPWWKKRHKKRLLFTADFAAECCRVLRAGGRLHFVTDVGDYFHMVAGLIAAQPQLRSSPPTAPGEPANDLDYLTHFERKFRKQGKPIYRACYENGQCTCLTSRA